MFTKIIKADVDRVTLVWLLNVLQIDAMRCKKLTIVSGQKDVTWFFVRGNR